MVTDSEGALLYLYLDSHHFVINHDDEEESVSEPDDGRNHQSSKVSLHTHGYLQTAESHWETIYICTIAITLLWNTCRSRISLILSAATALPQQQGVTSTYWKLIVAN